MEYFSKFSLKSDAEFTFPYFTENWDKILKGKFIEYNNYNFGKSEFY